MSSKIDTRLLGRDQQQGNSFRKCIERCCPCKLTKKRVLFVVCIMFACFAVSEIIGAAVGNSYSLLGDASATCLDAITYYCNYYAETLAESEDSDSSEGNGPDAVGAELGAVGEGDRQSPSRRGGQSQDSEKRRLMHDVYVPAFSVITLVVVTVVMLMLQIHTLVAGAGDDTNVMIMYLFATINSVVAITSMVLFYLVGDDMMNGRGKKSGGDGSAGGESQRGEGEQNEQQEKKGMFSNVDLNMFSAFTHVGSDTLRTIAIYAGAIVASTTGIETGVCDAWAAIVVSVTIFIGVIPLTREVYNAYQESRKG